MKIFYVTPAEPLPGEAAVISALLEQGVERVHLRHPGCELRAVERIVRSIPADMRPRLMLHDFHRLALDYGCGVHLNARNPAAPQGYNGVVSCSCHSLDEVRRSVADYCFLSPIFDSISKPGYHARKFDESLLRLTLRQNAVVALGGVTPSKFGCLRELGFSAAAMSGYLTGDGEMTGIINRLKLCFNS